MKTWKFYVVLGFAVGAFVGCDKEESNEKRLCKKIDECNLLGAAVSVQDCTDIVSMCTSQLVSSAKADWDGAAEGCLSLSNCVNFANCYIDIDVCRHDGGAGGGDGADDGADGPPECADNGEACEVNGDCCDFSEDAGFCVGFTEELSACAASCATATDCVSNCCVPLEEGGNVCAPAEFCA